MQSSLEEVMSGLSPAVICFGLAAVFFLGSSLVVAISGWGGRKKKDDGDDT